MLLRVLSMIALSSLLFACSNKPIKESESVPVEDLATSNQGLIDDSDPSRVESYQVGSDSTGAFSALDDPQSPLSRRIIYFEYDSSEVAAADQATVEAHAAFLVQNPQQQVTLEGHADERGTREYNLALGESRAISVRQLMNLLGVPSVQIRIISYGEERPQTSGHDEASWQQNRRVEIVY